MPPSSYSNVGTPSLESVCRLKEPEDSRDPREDSLPVSGQESPLIFLWILSMEIGCQLALPNKFTTVPVSVLHLH